MWVSVSDRAPDFQAQNNTMKIRKAISFLMGALALIPLLSSCTGDQALPPLRQPEEMGDTLLGDGTWNSPMAAYQVSLGSVPKDEFDMARYENWVTGYIVGWVNVDVSNTNIDLGADFTVPATAATNIMIASRVDEKDPQNIATVQLPSGAVRNALNLMDHPENLYKQVTIFGEVGRKYCGAYGVRSVTAFNWGDKGTEPDPAMVLPAGGRVFWTADLLSDTQGFTFDQGAPSTTGFETWKHSTQYGLVATGGRSGSAVAVEAWAVSPVIDMSDYNQTCMMLHQAANYFNNSAGFLDMCSVGVRLAGNTEWQTVTMPYAPSGSTWTFTNSGYIDLSSYAGQKIQIGLRYSSTRDFSGTWEVDKITIAGVHKDFVR